MTPSILVVGAGAVGAFYASRFDRQSAHVALVCRSNYDAVKRDGFSMKTHSFGDYTFSPDAVYASVDEARDQPWDYVVVATKALNLTTDAASFIAPVVSERTTIVLIQNGLDVEAPYRERFPDAPIVSAITDRKSVV